MNELKGLEKNVVVVVVVYSIPVHIECITLKTQNVYSIRAQWHAMWLFYFCVVLFCLVMFVSSPRKRKLYILVLSIMFFICAYSKITNEKKRNKLMLTNTVTITTVAFYMFHLCLIHFVQSFDSIWWLFGEFRSIQHIDSIHFIPFHYYICFLFPFFCPFNTMASSFCCLQ